MLLTWLSRYFKFSGLVFLPYHLQQTACLLTLCLQPPSKSRAMFLICPRDWSWHLIGGVATDLRTSQSTYTVSTQHTHTLPSATLLGMSNSCVPNIYVDRLKAGGLWPPFSFPRPPNFSELWPVTSSGRYPSPSRWLSILIKTPQACSGIDWSVLVYW